MISFLFPHVPPRLPQSLSKHAWTLPVYVIVSVRKAVGRDVSLFSWKAHVSENLALGEKDNERRPTFVHS